jgi:hypothetical protein
VGDSSTSGGPSTRSALAVDGPIRHSTPWRGPKGTPLKGEGARDVENVSLIQCRQSFV